MAMWRVDLRELLCVPFTVSLAAHEQPVKKRTGRNGTKKRPDGPNSGGGNFHKKTEDRPLQVQIRHAQEWDKGRVTQIVKDYRICKKGRI